MGVSKQRTFNQILKDFAPVGAMIVLEKARLASAVAKCAVTLRSRRAAYRIKEKLLQRAVDISEGKVIMSPDHRVKRWRLLFRGWGEIHGGRF